MDLLARIAPFFLLIAAGAVAGRLGVLGPRAGRALSAYTFWIGFPALLIHWLGAAPPPSAQLLTALAVYAVAMAVILFAAPVLARLCRFSAEAQAGLAMTSAVGNTAFLGAPLAVSIFGEAVRSQAAAVVAVDFIILMALSIGVLQTARGRPHPGKALGRALFNPTVAGALVGLCLSLGHVRLPEAINTPLGFLAQTASPIALISLGGLIGREHSRPTRAEVTPIGASLLLKLLAAPLLVWLALGLAGASGEVRATFTLLAACPTAVNVFIQTRAMNVYSRGAALSVMAGAIVSALSLTLWAHFLTR